MAEEPEYLTSEVLNFYCFMPEGDDLVLIVLKGHLLIEQQLETILETIFTHGKELERINLNFHRKAALAHAFCWRQHEDPMWKFIFALSGLRNHLAHSLGDQTTESKIQTALSAHEATLDPEQKARLASASTPHRLKHAIMLAMTFLGNYIGDAQTFRYHMTFDCGLFNEVDPNCWTVFSVQ